MSPTRCPLWLCGVLTLKPIDRCFWPFSDLAQCPLLRRCWVLSGHRGFMSTRSSVALDLKFLCELAATMAGTSNPPHEWTTERGTNPPTRPPPSVFGSGVLPAQDFADFHALGLEGLAQHGNAGVGDGLAAHEHVERGIARVGPRVDRDMALGQHRHPGHAVRMEMMQVDVQQRRLSGVHTAAQRRLDQTDVVEAFGPVQIDDEVHAGAAHAVTNGKMPFAPLGGGGLNHGDVSDVLSGSAWSCQALPRSQEGVLAHVRPPQPSDPTRVPTSGVRQANAARSARTYEDRSQRPVPHIRLTPPESRRFCGAEV